MSPHLIVLFSATGGISPLAELLPGIMPSLQSGLVPDSRITRFQLDDFDDDGFRNLPKGPIEFSAARSMRLNGREVRASGNQLRQRPGPGTHWQRQRGA